MVAELTTSNSLTLFGTDVEVIDGCIQLTWEQKHELQNKLHEAMVSCIDSLDFINNESISIDNIKNINRFWFEFNKLIADTWYQVTKVSDLQERFNKLVEDARA